MQARVYVGKFMYAVVIYH